MFMKTNEITRVTHDVYENKPVMLRAPHERGRTPQSFIAWRVAAGLPSHSWLTYYQMPELKFQNVTNEPVILLKLKESIFPKPSSC
jgi:hypothetical protein